MHWPKNNLYPEKDVVSNQKLVCLTGLLRVYTLKIFLHNMYFFLLLKNELSHKEHEMQEKGLKSKLSGDKRSRQSVSTTRKSGTNFKKRTNEKSGAKTKSRPLSGFGK